MFSVGRGPGREVGVVSRRDFLRVGSLSVVGLSVDQAALARARDLTARRSCIFILMTGGPSQLDTFDPKPEAPAEFRGPLRAISTAVPGIQVSEGFPGLAERMRRVAIVRSLTHQAAPIHETGFQLLQTGRLSNGQHRYPSFGSVVAKTLGERNGAPANVVLPRAVHNTGVNADRGQHSGFLGNEFAPLIPEESQDAPSDNGNGTALWPNLVHARSFDGESDAVQRAYGYSRFGRSCWQAARLVECGVRCVTVNLFDSLTNQVTWDCHASHSDAPATLYDYRDELCPQFDRAFCGLIDDLEQRGLLEDTLVVAAGEFGRTPRLNAAGGRDHWPGVWSALVAGAGVSGGQTVGASDAQGAAPSDRPVQPGELTATIYRSLGLDLDTVLQTEDGTEIPLVEEEAIDELFG